MNCDRCGEPIDGRGNKVEIEFSPGNVHTEETWCEDCHEEENYPSIYSLYDPQND